MTSRSRAVGISLLCAGILVVQLLWLVLIPPYGGIDEFDHAYRAASVANGHWAPKELETGHGRGNLILVPEGVVRDAHAACTKLKYTGHDNCNPASAPNASGEVLVASAAATYNPVFYFLIGTAAKPFHNGVATLYAMRIAAMVLCDALIVCALIIIGWTARTLWPVSAVMVVGTPMVLYSTAIVAPNGLQACAAVLMWCALLPAVTRPWNEQTARLLWVGSGASAVTMVTHSTGPAWVVLTLAALALVAGRSWVVHALAHHRRNFLAPLFAVALAGILCSAWIVWQGTNSPAGDAANIGRPHLTETMIQPVLWIFQSVAAIPFRNQAAPMSVYAIALLIFVAMLALGWRAGSRRTQLGMASIGILSFLVPLGLSIATYGELGFAWQGRYTLPFAFGVAFMASAALDDTPRYRRLSKFGALVAVLGSAFIEARELLYVGSFENQLSGPWAYAAVIVFCVASAALLCRGVVLVSRTDVVERRHTRDLLSLA